MEFWTGETRVTWQSSLSWSSLSFTSTVASILLLQFIYVSRKVSFLHFILFFCLSLLFPPWLFVPMSCTLDARCLFPKFLLVLILDSFQKRARLWVFRVTISLPWLHFSQAPYCWFSFMFLIHDKKKGPRFCSIICQHPRYRAILWFYSLSTWVQAKSFQQQGRGTGWFRSSEHSSWYPGSGGCFSGVTLWARAGGHALAPISISLIFAVPGLLHTYPLALNLFQLGLNLTETTEPKPVLFQLLWVSRSERKEKE